MSLRGGFLPTKQPAFNQENLIEEIASGFRPRNDIHMIWNVSMTPFHLLLANQSISFQIRFPNKKARLYVHRAFVHEIPVFPGESYQNNSQNFVLPLKRQEYNTVLGTYECRKPREPKDFTTEYIETSEKTF